MLHPNRDVFVSQLYKSYFINEIAEQAFKLYEEGVRNRELGSPELAISCFDKAIDLAPNHFLFYPQRGYSKRDLDLLDEALLDLEKAICLCEQQKRPRHHTLQLQPL